MDDDPNDDGPRFPRVLAMSLAVVVAVAGAGWWATHPDRLAPVGDSWSLDHVAVGQPVLFGLFVGGAERVTVRHVEPRVVLNTAGARVRVLMCLTGEVVGATRGSPASLCREVTTAAGAALGPTRAEPHRQLLVEVTPTRAGQVVIDGVRLSYRSGLRFGTEATGSRWSLTTP